MLCVVLDRLRPRWPFGFLLMLFMALNPTKALAADTSLSLWKYHSSSTPPGGASPPSKGKMLDCPVIKKDVFKSYRHSGASVKVRVPKDQKLMGPKRLIMTYGDKKIRYDLSREKDQKRVKSIAKKCSVAVGKRIAKKKLSKNWFKKPSEAKGVLSSAVKKAKKLVSQDKDWLRHKVIQCRDKNALKACRAAVRTLHEGSRPWLRSKAHGDALVRQYVKAIKAGAQKWGQRCRDGAAGKDMTKVKDVEAVFKPCGELLTVRSHRSALAKKHPTSVPSSQSLAFASLSVEGRKGKASEIEKSLGACAKIQTEVVAKEDTLLQKLSRLEEKGSSVETVGTVLREGISLYQEWQRLAEEQLKTCKSTKTLIVQWFPKSITTGISNGITSTEARLVYPKKQLNWIKGVAAKWEQDIAKVTKDEAKWERLKPLYAAACERYCSRKGPRIYQCYSGYLAGETFAAKSHSHAGWLDTRPVMLARLYSADQFEKIVNGINAGGQETSYCACIPNPSTPKGCGDPKDL
jgi:hypothetical protein